MARVDAHERERELLGFARHWKQQQESLAGDTPRLRLAGNSWREKLL